MVADDDDDDDGEVGQLTLVSQLDGRYNRNNSNENRLSFAQVIQSKVFTLKNGQIFFNLIILMLIKIIK